MKRIVLALFCLTLIGAPSGARAERTNAPPPPMPPMPRYQRINAKVRLHDLSPVAYFRVLLGMTPAERNRALAQKTPDERAAILRKVKEYEALSPDVRETRLRQTELRWTLVDLMKCEPGQRAERLRGLVDGDRPWIEARLRQWDLLPAAEQKAYLEKEGFINFYLRWQAASAVGQIEILNRIPAARRAEWMAELTRWQALPEQTRQQMCEQFTQFLDMTDGQRKAAASALSDQERRQMEISLRAFAQLPAGQRRQCVASFSKFATMTADDRTQFLRNAERWEEMAPQERLLWRQLVRSLPAQPPLPPGFQRITPGGLPPMPPGFSAIAAPPAAKNIYAESNTNYMQ